MTAALKEFVDSLLIAGPCDLSAPMAAAGRAVRRLYGGRFPGDLEVAWRLLEGALRDRSVERRDAAKAKIEHLLKDLLHGDSDFIERPDSDGEGADLVEVQISEVINS